MDPGVVSSGLVLAVGGIAGVIAGPLAGALSDRTLSVRARRDLFIEGFGKLGWKLTPPPAAMYIWDRVPKRYTDANEFAKEFFKATGVIVSPGAAFGSHSKEFMRISMVVDEQKIEKLLGKVKASGFKFD